MKKEKKIIKKVKKFPWHQHVLLSELCETGTRERDLIIKGFVFDFYHELKKMPASYRCDVLMFFRPHPRQNFKCDFFKRNWSLRSTKRKK